MESSDCFGREKVCDELFRPCWQGEKATTDSSLSIANQEKKILECGDAGIGDLWTDEGRRVWKSEPLWYLLVARFMVAPLVASSFAVTWYVEIMYTSYLQILRMCAVTTVLHRNWIDSLDFWKATRVTQHGTRKSHQERKIAFGSHHHEKKKFTSKYFERCIILFVDRIATTEKNSKSRNNNILDVLPSNE